MPVALASLSEGLMIAIVALGTEHPGRLSIFCHAVAAEIGKMRGKRSALRPVTDHAGFDHRDARSAGQSPRRREARGATPAKGAVLA